VAVCLLLGSLSSALVFLWRSSSNTAYKATFTVYMIVAFGVLARVIVANDEVRNALYIGSTKDFLGASKQEQLGRFNRLQRAQSRLSRIRLWRLIKGRGFVIWYSLLVVAAPIFALWARDMDVGLKIGVTVATFLTVFVVRIAFVGHRSRVRQEVDEE